MFEQLNGVVSGVVDVELLDNLFACLGAGVYATDFVAGEGGRVLVANPQCGELLGYSVDELVGAPIHPLVHWRRPDGSPLPVADCPLLGVGEHGTVLNGQDTFIRRDGTLLPVAWAGAPLRRDGEIVGTVIAFTDDTERRRAFIERERAVVREHEAALAFQRALLTEPPSVAGLSLAVRYLPAARDAEVGGDWYDAFPDADGTMLLVIGDVVGHDIEAAAAMGQLRSLLRGVAHAVPAPPGQTLRRLDRAGTALVGTLATAVLARLHAPDPAGNRRLDWSIAGHPAPIVLGADGSGRWLDHTPADLMLGVLPDRERHTLTTTLVPGDTLVLYTDGLVERREASLCDRLEDLMVAARGLSGLPPEPLLDALTALLLPGAPDDDTAVLAVRVEPTPSP